MQKGLCRAYWSAPFDCHSVCFCFMFWLLTLRSHCIVSVRWPSHLVENNIAHVQQGRWCIKCDKVVSQLYSKIKAEYVGTLRSAAIRHEKRSPFPSLRSP